MPSCVGLHYLVNILGPRPCGSSSDFNLLTRLPRAYEESASLHFWHFTFLFPDQGYGCFPSLGIVIWSLGQVPRCHLTTSLVWLLAGQDASIYRILQHNKKNKIDSINHEIMLQT